MHCLYKCIQIYKQASFFQIQRLGMSAMYKFSCITTEKDLTRKENLFQCPNCFHRLFYDVLPQNINSQIISRINMYYRSVVNILHW